MPDRVVVKSGGQRINDGGASHSIGARGAACITYPDGYLYTDAGLSPISGNR